MAWEPDVDLLTHEEMLGVLRKLMRKTLKEVSDEFGGKPKKFLIIRGTDQANHFIASDELFNEAYYERLMKNISLDTYFGIFQHRNIKVESRIGYKGGIEEGNYVTVVTVPEF